MKNTTLLVTILTASLAAAALYTATSTTVVEDKIPPHVVTLFKEWQMSGKRLYASPEEQNQRLRVFYDNYLFVTESNNQNLTYKLALNHFADMTHEEYKAMLKVKTNTSHKNIQKDRKQIKAQASFKSENLKQQPVAWDWSQRGCNSPIGSIGQYCRAGYAMTAIKTVEYAIGCAKSNSAFSLTQGMRPPLLSPQQIVDCSSSYGNNGCNGGNLENSYKYTFYNGLFSNADYNYVGQQGNCKVPAGQKGKWFITNYYTVTPRDNNQLMKAVRQQPVGVALDASERKFKFYSSGVMDQYGCSTSTVNHYVTLVGMGYDNVSGNNFWKAENSYGNGWGEGGYFRIKRYSGYSSYPCGIPVSPIYPYAQ